MRGRRARGAGIGLLVGIALNLLLIGLPTILSGDTYEIGDSMVFMGVPILIVSLAAGALIGAPHARTRP